MPPSIAKGQVLTTYGWTVCLWILIIAFQVSHSFNLFILLILFSIWQYGYHISALNQIQAVLTCKIKSSDPLHYGLPTCIPMSDFTFSVVTAIFTVGGLSGSLMANVIMDRWGRKGATKASAFFISTGAGLMGISSSVSLLVFGRQVYLSWFSLWPMTYLTYPQIPDGRWLWNRLVCCSYIPGRNFSLSYQW